MEGPFALILIVVAGLVLAAPILAIVALRRTGSIRLLETRLEEMQHRLAAIDRRLRELQGRGAVEAHPAAHPSTTPPHPSAAPSSPIEDALAELTGLVAPPEPPGLPEPPGPTPRPRPPQGPPPLPGTPLDPRVPPSPAGPQAPPPRATAPRAGAVPPAGGRPAPPSLTSIPSGPSGIDWERWLGIRGAAVLGAIALGLAGLLFFRYSIEHGLITPTMRVVFGTITGLACVGGSTLLRARGYRAASEGVAGAGVVILYAAFWAAHALYALIPLLATFVLMVLVTAACCLLAVRQESLLVAVLGLAGGFATPLLLSSGEDRPIGLFGYILLLDLGLLLVARVRRWPSLGLLSLLGTALMQALWIGARMGPDRLALGLLILAVFAALFAGVSRLGKRDAGTATPLARGTEIAALLLPFAFALYFAGRVELGPHLYPIALLLGALAAGAGFVARGQRNQAVATGAAIGCLAVVAVWCAQHALTTALSWEAALTALGLAAIFHLFVEIDPEPAGLEGPAPAAVTAALGLFAVLLAASASSAAPWAWLAGWGGLAALLYRHAAFPERAWLQLAVAAGLGIGLSLIHHRHTDAPGFPAPAVVLALLVGASVALQAAALFRREEEVIAFAERAAALLPILLLLALVPSPFLRGLGAAPALGASLLLGLLAAFAATRLGKGPWYAAAVAATWLVHNAWIFGHPLADLPAADFLAAWGLAATAVVALTLWPLLAVRRFSDDRIAWYAAALSGPLWFAPLRALFVTRFGDGLIGILPILLGALALGAAARARDAWPEDDPRRTSALAWFAGVALCFVAVAIPLQLEKQWVTIGWALQGLAVIALWSRLDHPGLKYFGLLLLGAATARLVANPALLTYYPRPDTRIVNWILYTYLVPAAALIGSAWHLRPREAERARPWESGLYATGAAVGAIASSGAAIAVLFVWMNLAIADWYATGPSLTLTLGGAPAQRLTVSITWAIYALLLLGLGMARAATGLRWLSLAFLLVTIGKVFLHDLGELRDLYRVASLVGLAVSLLLVSLLYQRFVFRREPA